MAKGSNVYFILNRTNEGYSEIGIDVENNIFIRQTLMGETVAEITLAQATTDSARQLRDCLTKLESLISDGLHLRDLKKFKEKHKLQSKQVVQITGLSASFVSRCENGKEHLRKEAWAKLDEYVIKKHRGEI
jgi:hypothetical protein